MSINKSKILSYLIAVSTFLFMQPYVTWKSYYFAKLFVLVEYACILGAIFIILTNVFHKGGIIFLKNIKSFFLVLWLCILFYVTGSESQLGRNGILLQYIYIILLVFVNDNILEKSLSILTCIMAILLIPAIIVLLFRYVGLNVPNTLLNDYREASTRMFIKFPLSIATSNIHSLHIVSYRLNGMFDEPGALGTYSILLLIANKFNLKKISTKILLLGGLFTLSTAFYLILFLQILYYIFTKFLSPTTLKISRKNLIISTLIIIMLGCVIIIFHTEAVNIWWKIFAKLNSDERSRGFNTIINNMNYSNIIVLLFGHGYASNAFIDSASAAILLYKVGVIGVIFVVLYLLFLKKHGAYSKSLFNRCIMFLVLLQRPYVLMIPYVVLFIFTLESVQADFDQKTTN